MLRQWIILLPQHHIFFKKENMPAPKNNKEEKKAEMSLLPLDVLADMLCPAYEEGVEKYERESWREGFQTSILMDACLRHLKAFYYNREDFDPERPEKHHLGAALFCLISMYHSWENYPEMDDRPLNKCENIKPKKGWWRNVCEFLGLRIFGSRRNK